MNFKRLRTLFLYIRGAMFYQLAAKPPPDNRMAAKVFLIKIISLIT